MNKIAVVIPLYNHAHFICHGLQSVLKQSHRVDRVIVVDDGSTDDSVAVARSVEDPRVEVHTQQNSGAHVALNRGIQLASDCTYTAILNSDDWYLPGRIAACCAHLEKNPEIDLVCTGLQLVDDDDKVLDATSPRAKWFDAVWSLQDSHLTLPEWLGIANFVGTTSNFFARTEWLRTHPFEDYRYVHDYYHLLVTALHGRLAILPEPLLSYRVHATNTISTKPTNLVKELLRMNLDLSRALAPELRDDAALRRAFADYQRTAWSNVSSFRQDVFQSLLAGGLAALDKQVLSQLIDGLDARVCPEISELPNRGLVNAHQGLAPLGVTSGLGGKFADLKHEVAAFKTERAAWSQLGKLRAKLGASRWVALGTLLGVCRKLHRDEGKNAVEKLASLQARIAKSKWLRGGWESVG